MRLKLCHPLESRDGTLNADSKMKNMVVENVEGELVAVKRPGVAIATDLVSGLPSGVTAQGLAYFNGSVFSMSSDVLSRTVPGGGAVGASWDEAIPLTPSYHYAMEIDFHNQRNPTRNANWVVYPIDPPYYPDYNFVDYPSIGAIVAYINATYPAYGPWAFVPIPGNYGTEYPNYPYLIGRISPADPNPWYPAELGGLGYVPLVIGHTR